MKASSFLIYHPGVKEWIDHVNPLAVACPIPVACIRNIPENWTAVSAAPFNRESCFRSIEVYSCRNSFDLLEVVPGVELPELELVAFVGSKEPYNRDRVTWSSHKGTTSRVHSHSFCKRIDGQIPVSTADYIASRVQVKLNLLPATSLVSAEDVTLPELTSEFSTALKTVDIADTHLTNAEVAALKTKWQELLALLLFQPQAV